MRVNNKPVEHRARCKFCGTPPQYYTNAFGSMYHTPTTSSGTVGRSNKYRTDWSRRRYNDKKEYPLGKLMRWNSIRGTAVTNSYYFKKNKENWGGYRIMLSCR